jgi:hypothetical protein
MPTKKELGLLRRQFKLLDDELEKEKADALPAMEKAVKKHEQKIKEELARVARKRRKRIMQSV